MFSRAAAATKSALSPHKTLGEKVTDEIKRYLRKKNLDDDFSSALKDFQENHTDLFNNLQAFVKHIDDRPNCPNLRTLPINFVQTHISCMIDYINQLMTSYQNILPLIPDEDQTFKMLLKDYCGQILAKNYRFTLCLLKNHEGPHADRKSELKQILRNDGSFDEIYDECLPLLSTVRSWDAANVYLNALRINVNTLVNTLKDHLQTFEPNCLQRSVWSNIDLN